MFVLIWVRTSCKGYQQTTKICEIVQQDKGYQTFFQLLSNIYRALATKTKHENMGKLTTQKVKQQGKKKACLKTQQQKYKNKTQTI